ncbi:uncharacterized protein LOC143035845 [Oratosquilla oratoria]|uniref:uncharacterized protein LOC143035845 n=1 Tax=Oratosquilla oratoria TaxID=337810 RepID=UPI003F7778DE
MTSSSWYRRTVFNFKGNREFTKAGYEAAKEDFNPADLDVSCADRHYMITGSNSGIGYEVALHIAQLGGIIHMVCRSEESGRKAQEEITKVTGNKNIFVYKLDLSRPRDVAKFAREFCSSHDHLHVLVNNAGCMVHERKLDDDGTEHNFAVNTLAVHILTMNLIPLLQASPDSRVVTVSSGGMFTVKLDSEDLMFARMDPFNGALAYSQNKRQQVVMTFCYAQMFDKVRFSCMHPGWADTLALHKSLPIFYKTMKDKLRSAKEGADTAVWLAISYAAVKHTSGLFFQDREPVSAHLPLAWTRSTPAEEEAFIRRLDDIVRTVVGIDDPLQSPDSKREDIPSSQVNNVSVASQDDALQKNDLVSEDKVVEGEEKASVIPETAASAIAKESIEVTEENIKLKNEVDITEVTEQKSREDLEASTAVTVVEKVDVQQIKENTSVIPEATATIITKEITDVEGTEQVTSIGATTTPNVKEKIDVVEFSKQSISTLPETSITVTTKELVEDVEITEQDASSEPVTVAAVTDEAVNAEASELNVNLEPSASTAFTEEETVDVIETTEQNASIESRTTTIVPTKETDDIVKLETAISTTVTDEGKEDSGNMKESTPLEPETIATVIVKEEVIVTEVSDENARLEPETVTTEEKANSEVNKQNSVLEPVTTEELIDVAEVTDQISSLEPRAAITISAEKKVDDFEVIEQSTCLEPKEVTVDAEEDIDDFEITEQNANLESGTGYMIEEKVDVQGSEQTNSLEPLVTSVTTEEVEGQQRIITTVITEEWTETEDGDIVEPKESTVSTVTGFMTGEDADAQVTEQTTNIEPLTTTSVTTEERNDDETGEQQKITTTVITQEWTETEQSDNLEPKETTVSTPVESIKVAEVTEQNASKELRKENEE